LNGLLLRVDYDKAPLSVHFARHGITQESLTAKRELATTFISADYNFGPAAGWATFTNSENKNLIGAGAITTNTYEIGVRVPMGQWTPFAFIGNGTLDNTGAFTSQAAGGTVGTPAVATTIGVGSVTASAYQIGVKYSLVKNATLWAGYGQSKFENSAKGDTDTVNGLRVGMTYGF
jgi:hypothetical protein